MSAPGPEFAPGVDTPPADMTRRELMKLMGASAALAGLGGCVESPSGQILPYTEQPPEVTPGIPVEYATSMVLDGFAVGLLARAINGRPIKIEGNPEHPMSLGSTTSWHQASVLGLYDPNRARYVTAGGVATAWRAFFDAAASLRRDARIWFVLYPQSSPVVGGLIERVRDRYARARFVYHTPVDRRAVYDGARLVYGRPLEAQYRLGEARRVVALDADFLAAMPGSLRWAREWGAARGPSSPRDDMSRVYAVEPAPSPTGSVADHRLAVRARDVLAIAVELLRELNRLGRAAPGDIAAVGASAGADVAEAHWEWIRAVARDLAAHAGASLVIAGDRQPAEVHAVAHLLNAAIGSAGRTLTLTEPALIEPGGGETLGALAQAIDAGEVDSVVILEANPVYTAPEHDLARRLVRVPDTAHLSLYVDETSAACRWALPAAHYLESWGDARAYDGTLSLVQPLIEPLYGGRTAAEVLAAFAGLPGVSGRQLLREAWRDRAGARAGGPGREPRQAQAQGAQQELPPSMELAWREQLRRGFARGSEFAPVTARPAPAGALGRRIRRALAPPRGLELALEQSASVYDGRFANNAWLQELPQPMTKLTWGNAAVMSPRAAARHGLADGDVVELSLGDRSADAPALVLPGHADDSVTLAVGYGRRGAEAVARAVGVDAYPLRGQLRRRGGTWFADGLRLRKTGRRVELARTQDSFSTHGRPVALHRTLAEYREHPAFTWEHRKPQPSMLPAWTYRGDQWAMTIDTTICTGCSACVVACQAENNIPVVGRQGVLDGREMHWIRIDTYFHGRRRGAGRESGDPPEAVHQPMLCQHCEQAPCEYVCPVYATVHSPDGLNEMVYNRCIGTRFCSNNCPYKVRRFNWFEYGDADPVARLQRNPDVTVRNRGVMEKCTYCVQRIRGAEIQARKGGRAIAPGEVRTACQQACPTGAIQFGSLTHEDTPMVRWRRQPRVYSELHELGTRPRTQYLAAIRNLNPEIG